MKKLKYYIKKLIYKFGYRVNKIGPYSIFDFESFLHSYIKTKNSFNFIQIGANDGVMNDPLYKFNIQNKDIVSGYVLEPLPDIFEKLKKNYSSCPNIQAKNFAIHSSKLEMSLYRVKENYLSKIPMHARGIASFDKDHWKKTLLIPSHDYIEEVKVKCVSFKDFINANSITSLDLLLIDTEGYDYEILMSIDYDRLKPSIIRFEHGLRNKVMSEENFMNICNHLNFHGYQIINESYDATAYILNLSDSIF